MTEKNKMRVAKAILGYMIVCTILMTLFLLKTVMIVVSGNGCVTLNVPVVGINYQSNEECKSR